VQIQITARHVELPADVRAFAESRLEKLGKLAPDAHALHLIVGSERTGISAEITLRVHQHDVVVNEWHELARGAIELAADRTEEQLRRIKEKRIDGRQRHEGGRGLNGRLAESASGEVEDEA